MKADEGNVAFKQSGEDRIGNRKINWNLQYLLSLLF
jgi:hypothetical protein